MEDEYLSLTEKGEKILELTFKASIEEWSKEKLDAEIKEVMDNKEFSKEFNEDLPSFLESITANDKVLNRLGEWNKILGKDEESVIK